MRSSILTVTVLAAMAAVPAASAKIPPGADLHVQRTDGTAWLSIAREPRTVSLAQATAGRRAPAASRVPWIVFTMTFGALGIIVAGVALAGRGRGPEPSLETAHDDHDESAAPVPAPDDSGSE